MLYYIWWGYVAISALFFTIAVGFRLYIKYTSGHAGNIRWVRGKTVFITGGTMGIGRETALGLAREGARVYLTGRKQDQANQVAHQIAKQTGNREVFGIQLDLCDFDSVRKSVETFISQETHLHILINNAGLLQEAFDDKKKILPNNLEATMCANYFGHFLLTNLFLDSLKASSPSRIINVSSVVHSYGRMDLDNLNFERKGYHFLHAYYNSKLAQILFTKELAFRLKDTGVTVNSLHPGVINTSLFRSVKPPWKQLGQLLVLPFIKTPWEGAQTTLYLAGSTDVENISGQYFADCQLASTSLLAADQKRALQLWLESIKLTAS